MLSTNPRTFSSASSTPDGLPAIDNGDSGSGSSSNIVPIVVGSVVGLVVLVAVFAVRKWCCSGTNEREVLQRLQNREKRAHNNGLGGVGGLAGVIPYMKHIVVRITMMVSLKLRKMGSALLTTWSNGIYADAAAVMPGDSSADHQTLRRTTSHGEGGGTKDSAVKGSGAHSTLRRRPTVSLEENVYVNSMDLAPYAKESFSFDESTGLILTDVIDEYLILTINGKVPTRDNKQLLALEHKMASYDPIEYEAAADGVTEATYDEIGAPSHAAATPHQQLRELIQTKESSGYFKQLFDSMKDQGRKLAWEKAATLNCGRYGNIKLIPELMAPNVFGVAFHATQYEEESNVIHGECPRPNRQFAFYGMLDSLRQRSRSTVKSLELPVGEFKLPDGVESAYIEDLPVVGVSSVLNFDEVSQRMTSRRIKTSQKGTDSFQQKVDKKLIKASEVHDPLRTDAEGYVVDVQDNRFTKIIYDNYTNETARSLDPLIIRGGHQNLNWIARELIIQILNMKLRHCIKRRNKAFMEMARLHLIML